MSDPDEGRVPHDLSAQLATVLFALARAPDLVHLVDAARLVTRAKVVKGTRAGCPIETGIVTLEVPAMVARALKGKGEGRDLLLLVHMTRAAVGEVRERQESRIVAPYVEGAPV